MMRRTQPGGNGCLIAPEVFEPVRRQLGVPDHVLDVLVAEPCLQRPRIVPVIFNAAFPPPAGPQMRALPRPPSPRPASLGGPTVNPEPLPGSLAPVPPPPTMRESWGEMARPSPVPP